MEGRLPPFRRPPAPDWSRDDHHIKVPRDDERGSDKIPNTIGVGSPLAQAESGLNGIEYTSSLIKAPVVH